VSLQVSPDGSRCTVACLWPRQLTIVALDAEPRIVSKIDLPFAPRNQLLVSDNKLVVTEAFGGRLAVIDLRAGAVESVRSLPGHNIRGLSLSGDRTRLLLTDQMLNRLAHAQRDDIHWAICSRITFALFDWRPCWIRRRTCWLAAISCIWEMPIMARAIRRA